MSKLARITEKENGNVPHIYGYIDTTKTNLDGYIKIGYTTRDTETRIDEQYAQQPKTYTLIFNKVAIDKDGKIFTDKCIHKWLEDHKFERLDNLEWFKCTKNDLETAYNSVVDDKDYSTAKWNKTFKPRAEQRAAIDQAYNYYINSISEKSRFLWNCKMRFGKTFTTYELCKKMNLQNILILTYKPAVEDSWKTDLYDHIDFTNWQFISDIDKNSSKNNISKKWNARDKNNPAVVFCSLQNILGKGPNGSIKEKLEFIFNTNWDIVVFDEYHFGSWRKNVQDLFKNNTENIDNEIDADISDDDITAEEYCVDYIKSNKYLYLSGTPFRAIATGEFDENQIYSWTYSDEQEAKKNWDYSKGENPYKSLPSIKMLVYKMPKTLIQVALNSNTNEFDLNSFFEAKNSKFIHTNEVSQWLDIIHGDNINLYLSDNGNKYNVKNIPMPLYDASLKNNINHTLWYLPTVDACNAMESLLRNNTFYNNNYEIVNCSGNNCGSGIDALKPVRNAMHSSKCKTITLTCGKLTTGVTVKEWSAIFMLRNMNSPESYFQAAFRVQSPWCVNDENDQTKECVVKNECYIIDFALNRCLKQISEYATKLNTSERYDREKQISDMTKFLPVLAYADNGMIELEAADIFQMSVTSTSTKILANKWNNASLLNLGSSLSKLLSSDLLDRLDKIPSFRSIKENIEIVINCTKEIKKLHNRNNIQPSNETLEEIKNKKKEKDTKLNKIKELLQRFILLIPEFMYLSDYREKSLKELIECYEKELFEQVTCLSVNDFNELQSIGIFKSDVMNDIIFQFKMLEDYSLDYIINDSILTDARKSSEIGLFDTAISYYDYTNMKYNSINK